MKKVRFGVVGAGGIARRRTIGEVKHYSQHAEIFALMDVNPAMLEVTAQEFAIEKKYTSLEELLRVDIEAVYVASPVYAHHDQVIQALRAGKHVLCEKPLGLNRREGEEMAAIAEKMGLCLGVGYMMRYSVYHRKIKEILEEGLLGQIVSGRAQLTCWYPPIPSAWRQLKHLGGGGALMDMGGHCVDLLEWLIGRIEMVCGFLDTVVHSYEVEDTATVIMKFENGAHGMVDNYFNVPDRAARNVLEIYGTKGAIFAQNTIGQDGGGKLWWCRENEKNYDPAQRRSEDSYEQIELSPKPLYAQEVDAFSLWVRGKEMAEIHYQVGLRNLAVLEAIYRSQEEGRIVRVNG